MNVRMKCQSQGKVPKLSSSCYILHFSLDEFSFDQHSFPSLSFRIKQIAVWNRVLPAKALIMDHVLGSQVLLLVTRYSQPGEVTDPNWHTRTNIWLVCATFNPDQIRKITAFKSCSMERGSRSTVLYASIGKLTGRRYIKGQISLHAWAYRGFELLPRLAIFLLKCIIKVCG